MNSKIIAMVFLMLVDLQLQSQASPTSPLILDMVHHKLNLAKLKADSEELRGLFKQYDAAWKDYRGLAKHHSNCASLYEVKGARFGGGEGLEKVVAEFRQKTGNKQQMATVL
jgi:hypothetical protein